MHNKIEEPYRDYLIKPKLLVVNKDFRNFYKSRTRHIMHLRLHEYENDRIIQLFLRKVAKYLIEYRCGVNIKYLGYFFIYAHPFPKALKKKNHYIKDYMPVFIPTNYSIFKFWQMDRFFAKNIRENLSKSLNEGRRYLNQMKGVCSYYNVKFST